MAWRRGSSSSRVRARSNIWCKLHWVKLDGIWGGSEPSPGKPYCSGMKQLPSNAIKPTRLGEPEAGRDRGWQIRKQYLLRWGLRSLVTEWRKYQRNRHLIFGQFLKRDDCNKLLEPNQYERRRCQKTTRGYSNRNVLSKSLPRQVENIRHRAISDLSSGNQIVKNSYGEEYERDKCCRKSP